SDAVRVGAILRPRPGLPESGCANCRSLISKSVSKLQEPATPCFVPARLIYTLPGKPRDARQFGEVKTPIKRRKRRKTNAAFVLFVPLCGSGFCVQSSGLFIEACANG